MPHSEEIPVPQPPASYSTGSSDEEQESDKLDAGMPNAVADSSSSTDPEFTANISSFNRHMITKQELNDLVRGLRLSKSGAELPASRLKQWGALAEMLKYLFLRHVRSLWKFSFSVESDIVCCKNVTGLMSKLNIEHNPDEWRLFIDESKLI